MKFLHISDLHIGKRVNEFSMLEEQRYILNQILEITEMEKPEAILIAGDVYDKSMPSEEAVRLLDEFLTKLLSKNKPVFMISGNHDSPERLGFGNQIMRARGLYIAGRFNGNLLKETLEDEYGKVTIYLLPFVKPAMVKPFFEAEIETYQDAVQTVIAAEDINAEDRNLLVAHQFVTYGQKQPERSDSESISIGGLDNVDTDCFTPFDYVALGHLHGPQRIGRDTIRYAGSPLKYSFSEARQRKSLTILELKEKGEVEIRLHPLQPLRDMREIKGPMEELVKAGVREKEGALDYIHATLTDEKDIYDAIGQLRQVYPNLMSLDFENSKSRNKTFQLGAANEDFERKNPLHLFTEFYEAQNDSGLSGEQEQIIKEIFEKAIGEVII